MAEGFGFVEGAAKRGFLEGAAKPCFSLICRKLLGKFHFQGFLFAASSRGSCNFGGLLLQQAPRKLSGKSFCCKLLGKSSFGAFHFHQALGNFALASLLTPASAWETLEKIPCKTLGDVPFQFKGGVLFRSCCFWPPRPVIYAGCWLHVSPCCGAVRNFR